MDLTSFLQQLTTSMPLLITTILTLGVILVNGWTDAPNAIATCISTRAIKPKAAILMASVFNFLGVLIMTLISSKVAETIYKMVDFGGNAHDALVALCAALFAIVLWATAAWKFGIPTSESHALIAGLSGAAIALHNGFGGINGEQWMAVIVGLFFSSLLGFGMGWATARIIELLFKRVQRQKANNIFRKGQIFGGAAMAFMHGAQDGQKFMSVFLLGVALVNGQQEGGFTQIPVWLMILCSAVMALGTSIGGYRIIKAVGMDMVKLTLHQGFAADVAAAGCLLVSSVSGVPVSTTHTKTSSMMGVAASRRIKSVNWGVVREMVFTWILTFPGCGLVGFLMAKLFMTIF